ncbi:MAG TPA: HEAT repeat domain-containing protein, partial [Pyrinomonadaceae bacterium]|nr:HEAT repeat domain-containing protein [Pyrinomonadaceae bacterium]
RDWLVEPQQGSEGVGVSAGVAEMSHGLTRSTRTGFLVLVVFVLVGVAVGQQTKNFIPVEGANLKARIDGAIAAGKVNAANGRFWVAYQFEVRPGVAVDFEIVDSAGGVYISSDGTSMMFDPKNETRELGLFLMYDAARESFIRADIYNLRRTHEYSNYPVYWAGRISNEESLNYLKSIVDSPAPQVNRLAERALFAIALHDDARVDGLLTEMVRRPVGEPLRSRAIYWLGNTPETPAKNTLFTEIVRNNQESEDARQAAMSALAMSRSAAVLPLLENLFETMPTSDLKRRALTGIGRNDNTDAAATYLIRVADSEKDMELRKSAVASLGRIAGQKSLGALTGTVDGDADIELQKQAVVAIGRRPKDEAIPILIRTARNHPKMPIRKVAIQMLGQTGDERAVAFFRELLSKD